MAEGGGETVGDKKDDGTFSKFMNEVRVQHLRNGLSH